MPIYEDKSFKDYVNSLPAATENDLAAGNNMPIVSASEIKKMGGDNVAKAGDVEHIKEKISFVGKSNVDDTDVVYVVDGNGNVICKIDNDGIHSTKFHGKNLDLNNILSTYDDAFYITDGQGNVIFKADKDGVSGLNIGGSSFKSPYKDKVMLSIGDSLSAHDKWQKWLVNWLGFSFDEDLNVNGKDGHPPMSMGGTAIMPDTNDSIYIRSLSAHYYNPDVIFVYAGQNDVPFFGSATEIVSANLGTINDKPYKKDVIYSLVPESEWLDYTAYYQGRPTFYSRCMGMIERLLESCQSAKIVVITSMQMWTSDGVQSVGRKAIDTAWKEICTKYSLPCVSLWTESGVNKINASSYYPSEGNVHPNDYGYKRIAETIFSKI